MKVGRLTVKKCHVRRCYVNEAQANAEPPCANAAFTQQHLKSASRFQRAVYSAEWARFYATLQRLFESKTVRSTVTLLQKNKKTTKKKGVRDNLIYDSRSGVEGSFVVLGQHCCVIGPGSDWLNVF